MIPSSLLSIDERDTIQLLTELLARRLGYLPEWMPSEQGADRALLEIAARYQAMLLQRLNRAPQKHKLAFLELLGIELIPAQGARVPMVFQLSAQAPDSRILSGARVAAPPPPESNQQIVFETERSAGLTAARLKEVYSLWPGRDQYIDHSPQFLAGQAFQPFLKRQLQDTPHILYIADNTLLALKGQVQLDAIFELTQPSDEPLATIWEYWDGKSWRGFKAMHPYCEAVGEEKQDGTKGFTRSGKFRLETDCAEAQKTTVNGIESYWIRCRLTETLPIETNKILPEVDNIKLRSLFTRLPLAIEEYEMNFESLAIGTKYDPVDYSLGQVIFTENKIPVSIDFAILDGSVCEVKAKSDESGTNQYLEFQNIALSFDFTALKGVANYVRFEFSFSDSVTQGTIVILNEQITLPDNVTVRNPYSSNLGSGLKLTIIPTDKGNGWWMATLIGSLSKLWVGSNEILELDNIVARVVKSEGFLPDRAFADTVALDLTKSFYPLGQQPQPGSTFYFTSEELFSKPKAQAQLFIRIANTPAQSLNLQTSSSRTFFDNALAERINWQTSLPPTPLEHKLIWEYWNGSEWTGIDMIAVVNPTNLPDFEREGQFTFTVPEDMALVKVNDQEARWMRAKLESGGYGFTAKITWLDADRNRNEFTYVVPQPPALRDFRLGYTWQHGPFNPERVLTYNDFQYDDRSYEATWPGVVFQPFRFVSDLTPALYLGFDKKLPVDRLNLYFDIVEERGETQGPALRWEYWDGGNWRNLSLEDETRALRVPGMVSFIGAEDSQPLARFNASLHWLRARLKEDRPPGSPTIDNIFPNAVWASQQQTITDDPLGVSSGQPNQVIKFRQIPVLAGEKLEIRELFGARAHVEWRILAMELFGDRRIIQRLEDQLAAEDTQTEVIWEPLRLRRDRSKRVIEAWVTWQNRQFLYDSGANDRHYTLERARGRVTFGDGISGKIPPLGAAVRAQQYRTGGGLVGNLNSRTITQVLSDIPGIEAVFNPKPSEGGADAETLENLSWRGPQTLSHRGRAIAVRDYETMAREASPSVAVVRAIPTTDASGRHRPGWVTLVIIPHSEAPRPMPSFGLREQVRKYIEARAAADLVAAQHIQVIAPDYLPVDVEVTIVPIDAAEAGAVEARVRSALNRFLHPLRGGSEGHGWQPGRDVFLSDIAAAIERVEGVDYAKELSLLLGGVLQAEQISIAANRTVVAGEIRIRLELN
jgi:uncharacterized phage protein gp47/JayE